MKKRVKFSSLNLQVPLECQTSDFGELDEEQIFILKNNGLDLILIENAAEIMRQVMMLPSTKKELGSIEKVLTALSDEYIGCSVLSSETFPLQSKEYRPKSQTGTLKDYTSKVRNIKKELRNILQNNSKCIMAIFAVMVDDPDESGDAPGHYGAFFFNSASKTLDIFDSMQAENSVSDSTKFFVQLGKDIFEPSEVRVEQGFTRTNSLQYTGGFPGNPPAVFESNKNELARYGDHYIQLINLQNSESQNHFCYMWSIWYLHLKMEGMHPASIANKIVEMHADPLIIIKRYIWSLFYYKNLNLIDKIPGSQREFFEKHFPAIWSNDPLRKMSFPPSTKFYRFDFPVNNLSCISIRECLKKSLDNIPILYVKEASPLTPETEEYLRCLKKK